MIGMILKRIQTGFFTNVCRKTAEKSGDQLHINH